MEVRQVAAGNGWGWIAEGFALFKQSPVIWIALFFIYLLAAMVLTYIPVVGPIVLNLLAPVFAAGFMAGCRALESGEELEINHLFAGFGRNTAQLVTVGGVYLAGIIIVVGAIFAGGFAMHGMPGSDGQAMAGVPGTGVLLATLLGSLLIIPLLMAYWFAPALVFFHDLSALQAMKLSFSACLHNIPAFLVYGLISTALMLVAVIPLGLGLLVMIPTMTASLYVSYRDVFNIERATSEGALP